MERLEDGLASLDRARAAIDALAKRTSTQCMKAIGNSEFCTCIAAKIPMAINFPQYVAVLAATKEEINYDKLSREDKEIYHTARRARDFCAK